ncbi:hypothetical protein [Mesorhizobium sp. SEMIA 3007]|nr:hypothetical protein [Mesorhizobium sp. SEMIA 3007]
MIEASASRCIIAMIGVFHRPNDVADLVAREINLEIAALEET